MLEFLGFGRSKNEVSDNTDTMPATRPIAPTMRAGKPPAAGRRCLCPDEAAPANVSLCPR